LFEVGTVTSFSPKRLIFSRSNNFHEDLSSWYINTDKAEVRIKIAEKISWDLAVEEKLFVLQI
jgi:hypothetical protein